MTNSFAAIASFVASPIMARYGYYQPYFIVGAAITTVSGGLTYTFDIDTGIGKQIGYQIVMGLGTGSVIQIPPIIAGVVTSNADKSVGLAAVLGKLSLRLFAQN